MLLTVERETPDQADVFRFLAQADERSRRLYPNDDRSGMTLSQLLQADVRFFVARSDAWLLVAVDTSGSRKAQWR